MSTILGLSGGCYHDAAACLVQNGRVVAFLEEERFSRRKHNMASRSASRAAAYCLAHVGLRLEQIDHIVLGWNPFWPHAAEYVDDSSLIAELLDARYFKGHAPKRLEIIDHHIAHAASAFYPSGFETSGILVVDGSGDGISTTLARGGPDGITVLKQYDYTQSLGWFYEAVTEHVGLGDWHNTGKLMGLAAYGAPTYKLDFVRPEPHGYSIDLAPFTVGSVVDLANPIAPQDERLHESYARALTEAAFPPRTAQYQVDALTGRLKQTTVFEPIHKNLAASAQVAFEECIMQLVRGASEEGENSYLCIAGGGALNCAANGTIWRHDLVKRLYVQPAAGDTGTALGAALELARRLGELPAPSKPMRTFALGPAYTDDSIRTTLERSGLTFNYVRADLDTEVAAQLAQGAVIGWFQGRAEVGPRALGQRSILADPRNADMRDYINAEIKHREPWRPLGPSLLAESCAAYLENPGPSDYMIVAYQATPLAWDTIPATIHVDGTVRPQAVSEATLPRYARLIKAFAALTNVPALLNTSFNLENEPIVCTPADAVRTFCSSSLDVLAIGNFLVSKPHP